MGEGGPARRGRTADDRTDLVVGQFLCSVSGVWTAVSLTLTCAFREVSSFLSFSLVMVNISELGVIGKVETNQTDPRLRVAARLAWNGDAAALVTPQQRLRAVCARGSQPPPTSAISLSAVLAIHPAFHAHKVNRWRGE